MRLAEADRLRGFVRGRQEAGRVVRHHVVDLHAADQRKRDRGDEPGGDHEPGAARGQGCDCLEHFRTSSVVRCVRDRR